ncbi:hypothetical protein BGX31_002233 [Mortierella sp. GBA43]|nr:hypothetical protein BGX31_002233 [Mortierella sp. GBA43]
MELRLTDVLQKRVGDLKKLIKAEKAKAFEEVDANQLTLWRVSLPVVPKKDRKAISLADVLMKEELDETDDISDVFEEKPPKKTIHIIVQRPLPAWRRGFGKPPETRPSLLSMDLPDPSTPDSTSRNLAAGSILDMVKENDRHHIPVFGVSGCGKTRAVIGLLSQHWGFYFNAADDDWGSGDMMTLYNTVRSYLKEIQAGSAAVDLERTMDSPAGVTACSVRGSVQRSIPQTPQSSTSPCADILAIVRNVYEDAKDCLVMRGCLPKIKGYTRFLVINDEAQFLGDQLTCSPVLIPKLYHKTNNSILNLQDLQGVDHCVHFPRAELFA